MSRPPESVPLGAAEIEIILDALDSHVYWQLSPIAWRHSGEVILSSDDPLRWADRPEPTDDERQTITEIERCRALADRLRENLV